MFEFFYIYFYGAVHILRLHRGNAYRMRNIGTCMRWQLKLTTSTPQCKQGAKNECTLQT